jgi:hypothetical protein
VLPCPRWTGTVELVIILRPCLIDGYVANQRLAVEISGIEIYRATLESPRSLRFLLPSTLFAGNNGVTLRFRHPDAAAPVLAKTSSDVRELGFMFERLSLIGAQTSPTAVMPPPAPRVAQAGSELPAPPAEVRVGKEGWLFLVGGTNQPLRYYTEASYFTDQDAERWSDLLIRRRDRFQREGVRYLHLAAPDKISVYPELFDGPLPQFDRHPIRLLEASLKRHDEGALLVNPLDRFSTYPRKELLYLQTDTHWTLYAAQLVLELVLQKIGVRGTEKSDVTRRLRHPYRHVCDLGSKLQPPVSEEYFWVDPLPSIERFYANDLARLFEQNVTKGGPVVHRSINVAFRNSDPDAIGETLVIFGDSFMDFQNSNATMLFAENFRETHFIWSPDIDYAYVARVGGTLVLSETAERFMISLPTDEYDIQRESAAGVQFYADAK